ncbi:MAG: serine hydrolase domain-containing protein [Ilumatobacteraceae bacterium]
MHRILMVVPVLLLGCASGERAVPAPASTEPPRASTDLEDVTTLPAGYQPVLTSPPSTVATPEPTAPPRDFSDVDGIVADFVAERGLNGAGLIVVDAADGVVHEQYWGVWDSGRVSLVASSTKQITAGVLLHLQDQGLIDLDAPVAEVVPWGSANPTITTAQLLSSRSGLVGLLPDAAYPPYLCQFTPDGTLQSCAEQVFTSIDDDGDQVPPDTEFRYGGAQWQVAGGIAEAVSGRSWAELIEEIYVEPCGVETLGYNNHFAQLASGFDYPTQVDGDLGFLPPTANPNMEGGAYISVPDYGRLLLMHLDGGRCGDTQVLSAEALGEMYTDGLAAWGGSTYTGGGYGMGWWIDRETGRLTDPGAYGAVPWLDLDDGYGAYLVIERDAATGTELAGLLFEPVERALRGG